MTTIDRDSIANLGILSQFDAMFRPQAKVLGRNPPGHDDPEDDPEDEEAAERERQEEDNYREVYHEDSEPGICGNLYDGR
jgi:hypothetical protein